MAAKKAHEADKAVVTLTAANFDDQVILSTELWIVVFMAPWSFIISCFLACYTKTPSNRFGPCSRDCVNNCHQPLRFAVYFDVNLYRWVYRCHHCESLEPELAMAAAELRGKAKLGTVDVDKDGESELALTTKYEVESYPTIKVFPAGLKTGEATHYSEQHNGRTAQDFIIFAENELLKTMPDAEISQLADAESYTANCKSNPSVWHTDQSYPVLSVAAQPVSTSAKLNTVDLDSRYTEAALLGGVSSPLTRFRQGRT